MKILLRTNPGEETYFSNFQKLSEACCEKIKGPVVYTQPVFTCSKLTIETLEQGVKYVQS